MYLTISACGWLRLWVILWVVCVETSFQWVQFVKMGQFAVSALLVQWRCRLFWMVMNFRSSIRSAIARWPWFLTTYLNTPLRNLEQFWFTILSPSVVVLWSSSSIGLVRISARWSTMLTLLNVMLPDSTSCQKWWYLMFMCRVEVVTLVSWLIWVLLGCLRKPCIWFLLCCAWLVNHSECIPWVSS